MDVFICQNIYNDNFENFPKNGTKSRRSICSNESGSRGVKVELVILRTPTEMLMIMILSVCGKQRATPRVRLWTPSSAPDSGASCATGGTFGIPTSHHVSDVVRFCLSSQYLLHKSGAWWKPQRSPRRQKMSRETNLFRTSNTIYSQ